MRYLSRDAPNPGERTTNLGRNAPGSSLVDGSTTPTVRGPIDFPLLRIHRPTRCMRRDTTDPGRGD